MVNVDAKTLLQSLFLMICAQALAGVSAASNAPAKSPEAAATRKHLNSEFDAGVEASLAVSGAPAHLRAAATVYVYKKDAGFELHRQGSNEFTCLLNRDAFLYGGRAFKPTCWDKAGADSYIPVMLATGKWLAEGKSAAEVKRLIEKGFNTGFFHSPATTGIAYMVAGDLDLDPQTGNIIQTLFPGHYMFYAPHVTSEQLGASRDNRRDNPKLPSVFSGGAGGANLAYIITMVGALDAE